MSDYLFIIILLFVLLCLVFLFFFNATAPTLIYTLSLHDALPISSGEGEILEESRDPARSTFVWTPGPVRSRSPSPCCSRWASRRRRPGTPRRAAPRPDQ